MRYHTYEIVPQIKCDPLRPQHVARAARAPMSPHQRGAVTLNPYVRYRTEALERMCVSRARANAPAKTRPGRNARIPHPVRFNVRARPAAVASRSRLPWNTTGRAASASLAWSFRQPRQCAPMFHRTQTSVCRSGPPDAAIYESSAKTRESSRELQPYREFTALPDSRTCRRHSAAMCVQYGTHQRQTYAQTCSRLDFH
jgi:hypothetical protein